jgi:hypothetical protein
MAIQSLVVTYKEKQNKVGVMITDMYTLLTNNLQVSVHFRRICKALDNHKKIFKVFPSKNNYTSVICGSLALIINAAVQHDAVVETISQTVTDITDEATQAEQMLHVFDTEQLRKLFSKLYAQVFLFYCDVIEWFMQSKFKRFIGSFNENLRKKYSDASRRIDRIIKQI